MDLRSATQVSARARRGLLDTSCPIALVTILLICISTWAQDTSPEPDVVLQGGRVIDGTGAAEFIADVGLKGDRIVAIGTIVPPVTARVIDCRGLIVAPGFIDLHTHSDAQVVDPLLRGSVNYLLQGCTTQVTGNCGSGPIDTAKLYQQIEREGAGTNVAHLLPQGALRREVLGSDDRRPTDEEMSKMLQLAEKAMRDGAWGMSTGLIYVPSVYADTEEITRIAKVIGAHGGIYASHIRGEGGELLQAIEESIAIGRDSGAPAHISHLKSSGEENWGKMRVALERIEQARKDGARVTADQYPYTASSTSLEATIVPTWARAGGDAKFIARLDDPETGPRLKADIADSVARKRDGAALFIVRYAKQPAWIGKNLAELAASQERPAIDVALEILRSGGAAIVNFSMAEDDVRLAMQRPWVATASDGRSYVPGSDRPHPRSYGTFARKVGFYALREQVLPLEQAIRSCSGLPAEILGLADRGRLQQGCFADVVVLDPQTYIDTATFADPHHYATGVRYVFVNGQPAVHEGLPTGALAGRALRHPSKLAVQSTP